MNYIVGVGKANKRGLTFSKALEKLKDGMAATRLSWGNADYKAWIKNLGTDSQELVLTTSKGDQGFRPTTKSLLATDWVLTKRP